MKRKAATFEDIDFQVIHKNFYNIDKEFFEGNKPTSLRLSSGYINFDKIKNEKDFYEKAVRYITRTAFSLFSFITKENVPSIRLDLRKSEAYCSLVDNKIMIGLNMLTFKKIPDQLKVDTIIATVFHEMFHKKYTIRDIKEHLKLHKDSFYKNPDVINYLKKILIDETFKSIFNILEDRRIEHLGAIDFPGYSFYFEESRKYAYYLHSGKKIMPKYEALILDYLMMEILLPELKDDFLTTFVRGRDAFEAFNKLEQISKEEYELTIKSYESVKELFVVLGDYIKNNKKIVYSENYDEIIKATTEIYELIPKEIKEEINSMIGSNDIKGFIKITEGAGGKSFFSEEGEQLSNEMISEIEGFISDELESIEKEAKEQQKNQETKVKIEKVNSASKHTYYTEYEIIEEPAAATDTIMYSEAKKISKNICNNLGFLDSKFSRNVETYELSEGSLDEDELFSISIGNKYLFEDVEPLPAYSLDFGILLDESGSMSSRINEAKLATLSMILGLKDNSHINLFVYGHTANRGSNHKAIQIYKYYNTIQNFTDYRKIFSANARSNNADGYAIEKLSEIMKESKSRNKIMIVVSDGQPSASGYGGSEGETHVKEVVDRLESEGITVIQVCMAYIENSPKMFKHFVPYEKDGSFFDNLKKILISKLNKFADAI